jgi:alpha-L-arabinofuranosidase
LCEPNCAEGKRVTAPVNITLSNLTEHKGKYYLRTLDIGTLDGKDLTSGRTPGLRWDVMEFVEIMKWAK